jgi:hypothetical protein
MKKLAFMLLLLTFTSVGLTDSVMASSDQGLLISQIKLGGKDLNGETTEYIAITNTSEFDISLSGLRIEYLRAPNNTSLPIFDCSLPLWSGVDLDIHKIQDVIDLQPGQTIEYSFSLTDGRGGVIRLGSVAVVDDVEVVTIHDIVGWNRGSSTTSCASGSPIAINTNLTASRIYYQLGDRIVMTNTGDNSKDFVAGLNGLDVCINIADVQPTLPVGFIKDEVTSECNVPTPPLDDTAEPPGQPDPDDPETPITPVVNLCDGLILSEIAANVLNQFIEIRNSSPSPLDMKDCKIQTNRSDTQLYSLPDYELDSGEYYTIWLKDTDLTLTKTTTGVVYLLSSDSLIEVDSVAYANLKPETSWSEIDDEWMQTYTITSGEDNEYTRYPPCEVGYERNLESGRCVKLVSQLEPSLAPCAADQFRNPLTNRCNKITNIEEPVDCGEGRERNVATGRCRNIVSEYTLVPCREDQYRSEETNRCRSIATMAASALKPCADDQFRNPLTNRCKKIASVDELADCGEGRERNPETNRCRNVVSMASMPKAAFAVEPIKQTGVAFVGWWALGGVLLLAFGYAGWEWRHEIYNGIKSLSPKAGGK